MTGHAVEAGVPLRMAFDAEAHVDFHHGNHTIHRLDRSMAVLTLDSLENMRSMGEPDEIRQGIDPIPTNLERWLAVVSPRARHRLDTRTGCPRDFVAMASDASRNRRDAGLGRARSQIVTVLAGNLVDAGMNPMTERYRLFNVGPGSPWALGEGERAEAANQQEQGKREHDSVHDQAMPIRLTSRPRGRQTLRGKSNTWKLTN
jgi:hypothetical protein